ncbi:hypothetical protein J7M02_03070, partial [Candidatus Aerophobetes bacterium]|nr:hypothetical protein [Candidatus Aerophobetes bacterium]
MKQCEFKKRLKYTSDYIFNYGLRKLRQQGESLEDAFNRVGPEKMRKEDFKGFIKAQEQILRSILFIEEEIIAIRAEKKRMSKGKHKRELQKNKDYIEINTEEQYLMIQEAAFRELANSIVWILFGGTRGYLRRLVNPDSRHGYLCDKNWKSVMSVIERINKEKDRFALMSDITSTVGIGDILVWGPEGLKIIEVKESKINEKILKLIEIENGPESIDSTFRKIGVQNPSVYKQITRVIRQLERMRRFEEIYLTDQGTDSLTGERIHIIKSKHKGESINFIIGKLIENPPKEVFVNSLPLLLLADCFTVGITGLGDSEFVRRANFQHTLYHLEQVPWERCDYILSSEIKSKRNLSDLEPQVYLTMPVQNLRDSIFIPTHLPLYLLIGAKAAMKLIFGEISIFIKFYPEKFKDVCNKLGVNT